MIRLGLCCIFREEKIHFRTATAAYLDRHPNPRLYLEEIVLHNATSLLDAVEYCHRTGIGCFRITSRLFPLYTHPAHGYHLDNFTEKKKIYSLLETVRQTANKRDIRLTLHPDQFVVLNSPREDVVSRSIEELEYHNVIADLVGVDVINIHGGGAYGDKRTSLERFVSHFSSLPPSLQQRLTVENDDKLFTPEDLIPVCQELQIPLVYDVHHHRCHGDRWTVEEATEKALTTWNREPLFHLSSPRDGWGSKNPRLHHDYIDHADFPDCWRGIDLLTIEVEAKAKEKAVLKLMKELRFSSL